MPANLVNVTLREASISGGTLAPGSPETVQLGTLLPGESATAKFQIISQRTGSITFSNLTTSDDSLVGRFRLRAGVDERLPLGEAAWAHDRLEKKEVAGRLVLEPVH